MKKITFYFAFFLALQLCFFLPGSAQITDTMIWDMNNTGTFTTNAFRHVDIDSAGRVWVGTNGSGVFVGEKPYDNNSWTAILANHQVRGIQKDPNGDIWISSGRNGAQASTGGIRRYDALPGTTGIPDYWGATGGLPSRYTYGTAMYKNPLGMFTSVYTAHGPNISPTNDGGVGNISTSIGLASSVFIPSFPSSEVRVLAIGNIDDKIWLSLDRSCNGSPCDEAKIVIYDPILGSSTEITSSNSNLPFTNAVGGPTVRAFYKDVHGNTWLGTNRFVAVMPNGNNQWNILDGSFFSLPSIWVNDRAITEDGSKSVYFGTRSDLLKFMGGDPTDLKNWKIYGSGPKLPSADVRGILYDETNQGLWLTTSGGIVFWPNPKARLMIKVIETGPTQFADSVSLWHHNGMEIGINLDANGYAIFDTLGGVSNFSQTSEVYVWQGNALLGKMGLVYTMKDVNQGRSKEVIVIIHSDLASYGDHPREKDNDAWLYKNWYNYNYGAVSSLNPPFIYPTPVQTFFFQTSMLVAPVAQGDSSHLLSAADPMHKPVVFVHGVTGTDRYWGADNANDVINPQVDNPSNNFNNKVDYLYSSYPGRVRAANPDWDVWEYYYPPDQSWKESGYLFGKDLSYILDTYYNGSSASVIAHSMGGLVTRSYVEEVAESFTEGPSSVSTGKITFNNNIDRVLFLGTPQHGSFGGNRLYWGIFLNPALQTAGSSKDHAAPANRELSIGSEGLMELNDKATLNNQGVDYLQLTGTTWKGLIPNIPRFNCTPVTLEAELSSDGIVSITSSNLLGFGVPFGLIEGFSHFHLNSPDVPMSPISQAQKDIIPNICKDFLTDGTLNDPSSLMFSQLITSQSQTAAGFSPIPKAPTVNAAYCGPVQLNVGLPIVQFEEDAAGNIWQPEIPIGQNLRFRVAVKQDPSGWKARIIQDPLSNTFLQTTTLKFPGIYLVYGQNYSTSLFDETETKITFHNQSPAFYGYESSAGQIPFPNPFSTTGEKISLSGVGWELKDQPSVNLSIEHGFILNPDWYKGAPFPYFRNTQSVLTVKRMETTYNRVALPPSVLPLVNAKQFLESTLLDNSSFAFKNGVGDSLVNLVDCYTNSTSFVLNYGTNPAPVMKLRTPSGSIIDASQANNLNIYYSHDTALQTMFYSIIDPDPGKWAVEINGDYELPDSSFQIAYPMDVRFFPILKDDTLLANNDSVVLYLSMPYDTLTLEDLSVYAYAVSEKGDRYEFSFNDKGLGSDTLANDGVFAGTFYPRDSLVYRLVANLFGKINGCDFVRQVYAEEDFSDFNLTSISIDSEIKTQGGLLVFPNPSSGKLNIQMSSPNQAMERIELFDLQGRTIRAHIVNQGIRGHIQTDFKGIAVIRVSTNKNSLIRKVVFK